MELARILRDQGTNTSKIFRDIGTDPGGASVRCRGGLFLDPICESESESSLLEGDFKPRTFDDNLVRTISIKTIIFILSHCHNCRLHFQYNCAQASYFQEVGPLEEEKSVEEIFVSGQKSAVEFGIDLQRR